MAWTKKCTETTFAGWKQQMNILTIGDIPDKGGWKIYGMELPDTVLEKVYPLNAKRLFHQFRGGAQDRKASQ